MRRFRLAASALLFAAIVRAPSAGLASEPRREGVAAGASVPVEAVTALFQDRAGFLWVGSREGLMLFDGYASTLFEHDVADPESISDNAIRTVFEDREGRLWIGTNTGGLDTLDRATSKFRSFRHDSANPRSISNDSVYAVAQDRKGRLWVGTQRGLNRFDPSSGAFDRIQFHGEEGTQDYVDALLAASDGSLWIGTVGEGLGRLDPDTGGVTLYPLGARNRRGNRSDDVFSLAEESSGTLWVGTSRGVDRFDPATGRRVRVPFAGINEAKDLLVTSLAFASDGTLWASTFDSGLWSVAPGARVFRKEAFQDASGGVPVKRLICLLADRTGSIWVGTWGSGLARVSRNSRGLSAVAAAGGRKRVSPDTTAVFEDHTGALWIGESASLLQRRPDGRVLKFGGLGGAVTVRETSRGHILVGTVSSFAEIDPARRKILSNAKSSTLPDEPLGPGWVWSVLEDHLGRVWVGTGGGGLFRRRADGSFDRLKHDPTDPRSLSDDYVIALLEGDDGTIWVGTRSGGLNALAPGGTSFERYVPTPSDPRSISHHSVTSLLKDSRGTIWVATGGGGLNRIDRDPSGSFCFTRFTERDGLVDDNVVSLADGGDGTLWIGTRRGLSRFDPSSGSFASFGAMDGLPSVEFETGAATAGRDAIYFGTHRGVVAVRRGVPFPRAAASPTVLTSVRTLSGHGVDDRPPWEQARVDVPYGESLAFEMAVLDFGDRRRHRYAYRLDGLSKDWVDLGTRREITLTHLNPGIYELHVKGRNEQGVWSEAPGPLSIRIAAPFWMTAWFRAAAVALLVGIVLGVHRLRTATLERSNRALTVLKEEREGALDEARQSQKALHQAYARLRRLTRRLEAAKEDERKRIARELHDEIGQILTTAKLNLQLLPGTTSVEDRDRRVGDTIGLIDRLIGHVRALSLDLRPPLLDELGLSAALRGYVEAQAQRSGITIDLVADQVPPGIPNDVEIAAFRAVQESITNVLRHAEATAVTVELRYDPGWLDLRISDDGRGFDATTVFDRASEGRHLGLLGMRERVESMGGSMTVESTAGEGSVVAVHIPWEK